MPGQCWNAQPCFTLFSHSQRSTVSRDTRGTLRLHEGDGRCSFLLAPGSCQCFSSNGFSPLHEQSSSSSRWLRLAVVLKPPGPGSWCPLKDASTSQLTPLFRDRTPALETAPLPGSSSPSSKFPYLNNWTSSAFHQPPASSCSPQLSPGSDYMVPFLPSVLQHLTDDNLLY